MEQNYFLNRYKEILGEKQVEKLLKVKLSRFIRVNTIKTSHDKLIRRLEKIGISLKKVDFLTDGYEVKKARFSPGAAIEFLLGYYYIQEAASQCPAQVLNPKPGEVVLDMASAPGGKTSQLAQYMNNKGVIIALDTNSGRLKILRDNLERMGVKNTLVYRKDARFAFDLGVEFDKVLLDAPCSGNFIDDKEWLGKRKPEDIKNRVRVQRELLKAAIKVLKTGGELVYSTCSMEPEENEFNINWLLQKYTNLRLLPPSSLPVSPGLTEVFGKTLNPDVKLCGRFWPHLHNTQGFFIAHLKKE